MRLWRTFLTPALLVFLHLTAATAFADALSADGFKYSDKVTILGIKAGQLQTRINGNEMLFDLDKVESMEFANQPKFNEAEGARKDPSGAAGLYKDAIDSTTDERVKILAELRAISPADAAGRWTDAVSYFLEVYAASPTDSVWKFHPTNLPPATSAMLKESAKLIDSKLAGFQSEKSIKNLKRLELDVLKKAGDPRAATLAADLGPDAAAPALISSAPTATTAASEHPETVAQMEARLAKLQAEVAILQAQINAAKGPSATKQDNPLVTQLNTLPKNLWPASDEQEVKRSLREKWLDANVKSGAICTISGEVRSVSPAREGSGIEVELDCGVVTVWGQNVDLTVGAGIVNVTPEKAVDWEKAKNITVSGPNGTSITHN